MTKQLFLKCSVCLLFVLGCSNALASQQQLQRFFETVSSLQADFTQHTLDKDNNVIDIASGKVYLSRPGRFRWDYADKDGFKGQQIYADGKAITLYDADLEQATVQDYKEALGQVPSLLLVHSGVNLQAHFEIEVAPAEGAVSWVALKPKAEQASFNKLLVGFQGDTLAGLKIIDSLGVKTVFHFTNFIKNQAIKASVFEFKAPEGVDIMEQ